MTKATDLIGLGMPPQMAVSLCAGGVVATAFGTSAGSANPLGRHQRLTLCLSGTSSFVLPAVGGDNGCLLSDIFIVANMTAASIKVYANNTASGSVTTMYGGAASTAGTTGVTVPAGLVGSFTAFSPSTFICSNTSV